VPRASAEGLQNGAERKKVLARGDRHLEPTPELGEPGDIRVMHRILQPRDAGVLQYAPRLARSSEGPALDGVDHDANARADGVAHLLDTSRLRLGRRLLA